MMCILERQTTLERNFLKHELEMGVFQYNFVSHYKESKRQDWHFDAALMVCVIKSAVRVNKSVAFLYIVYRTILM